jgi:OmcA/MtrC family decaheme c-type cytochrome
MIDLAIIGRRIGYALVFGALLAAEGVGAQVNLWEAAAHFQYNIEKVGVTALGTTPQSYSVKVVFSVTDPTNFQQPWDIKNALPFQSAGAQLSVDVGWDPALDFTNTGGKFGSLAPLTALGDAPAFPVRAVNLTSKTLPGAAACTPSDCGTTDSNRFFVVTTVTPLPGAKTGRVALEGHPVCNGISGLVVSCPPAAAPPAPAYLNVPARSAAANFTLAPPAALAAIIQDPRRAVVDFAKCKVCHDGADHGTGIVPRLSLHGANRNENLAVCVICHNANQTDVPYRRATIAGEDVRISGPEVPIDFKTMVHSIHSGGFRTQPFVVIGRNSSVNDFSDVRFPKELRDCTNCHIDVNGKGTFELPLSPGVLGTTINTRSSYLTTPRSISVDPSNDQKISPIAAVCSSCHDKAEVKSHMVRTGGASFDTTQAAIGKNVVERCATCHGPGKEEDVRRAHQIRSGSGSHDD